MNLRQFGARKAARSFIAIGAAFAAISPAVARAADGAADHTVQIVLLGTKGGPGADAQRSEPASLLTVDGKSYLIDVGDGTARQLAAANHTPASVRTIFITHHHLDHTAGLEPLMALSWIGGGLSGQAAPPVEIYGPPATRFLVDAAERYIGVSERIFRAGIPTLPTVASMFAAHDIDRDGLAYRDDRVRVTAVENTHFHHPSKGTDGVRDRSLSYRFDTPAGSVVFTGDTGPSDAVAKLAEGADILVSEVYRPDPSLGGPKTAGSSALGKQLAEHMATEHLTPEEVGKLAARAHVKKVVLSHLVTGNSPEAEQALKDGVHKFFDGPVIVGHDLMTVDLAGSAPSP